MIHLLQTLAIFLLKIVFELYTFAIIFRLLLQFYGANYFNPVCQSLIKITDPVVKPLQLVLPRVKALDLALVGMVLIVQYIKIIVLFLVLGSFPNLLLSLLWAVLLSLNSLVNFYFYAILLYAILSWLVLVPRFSNQQALVQTLFIVVTPILKLIRKRFAKSTYIDFSPLIALILLEVFSIILFFILQGLGAPRMII